MWLSIVCGAGMKSCATLGLRAELGAQDTSVRVSATPMGYSEGHAWCPPRGGRGACRWGIESVVMSGNEAMGPMTFRAVCRGRRRVLFSGKLLALLLAAGCSRAQLSLDEDLADAGMWLVGDELGTIGPVDASVRRCRDGRCSGLAVGAHCVGPLKLTCERDVDGCLFAAAAEDNSPDCQPQKAVEICDNGVDDDGNGLSDCQDPTCFSDSCVERCDDGRDNDSDGFVDCDDSDCGGAVGCDECSEVLPQLDPASASTLGSTVGQSDRARGSCGGTPAPEVRYSWSAATTGCVMFSTVGSNFDTVLYATTACPEYRELACNDDTDLPQSTLSLNLRAGDEVVLHVDGYMGAAGDFELTASECVEQCRNAVDDDLDGAVDCEDAECADSPLCRGETDCNNGLDDDQNGSADCDDPNCGEACLLAEDCSNGADDNGDGAIDCADSWCQRLTPCSECAGVVADLGSAFGRPVISGMTGASNQYVGCGVTSDGPDDAYQWRAPASGCYVFDTLGSAFDTTLSVNESCPSEVVLQCDDDSFSGRDRNLSEVRRLMTEGALAVIVVDGSRATDFGKYDLNIAACAEDCRNGTDDDADGLVDCADVDCDNNAACLAVEICTNGLDDDADAAIDCLDPDCAQDPSCIESPPLEICDNGLDDDGDGAADCQDSECSAAARCDCLASTPLPSATGISVGGSTLGEGNDIEATCGEGAVGEDVIFTWIAPASACYRIDTRGSDFDTVLHVRTSCPDYAQTYCDDDTIARTSRVDVDAEAGREYVIVVDGFDTSGGDYMLNIDECP